MNAPLRLPEVNAHLAIITILDKAIAHKWHWAITRDAVWRHLEGFAPRCNCGLVLRFGPRVNGNRLVACSCGVGFMECDIQAGVP